MTEPSENIAEILRLHQIRATRTALELYAILQEKNEPAAVEALYDELRARGNTGNISTVYRTIERFMEKGLVLKHAYMADGKSLYELAGPEHHHYFRCLKCGRLVPVAACPVHELIESLSRTMDVQVTTHKLELSGYCGDCMPPGAARETETTE